MSAVFGEGEKKDLRGFLTQCFLPALLSLFKLTPTLELTRYLQYSEFHSPICSAHGAMGQWRALMFHSGDNKVLQTDGEKEREKAWQPLREAKRAKGSLQERRPPGGFRLYGRPARSSSVAQRACRPDTEAGDVGARAAPEPGCRLSEVRGSESQSRGGVGLQPCCPRLPFLLPEPRMEGREGAGVGRGGGATSMNRQRAVLGLAEDICSLASSAGRWPSGCWHCPAPLPRSNDPRERCDIDCVLGVGARGISRLEAHVWSHPLGTESHVNSAVKLWGEASASSWRSADNFSLCSFYAAFSNHHHHHPHHPSHGS